MPGVKRKASNSQFNPKQSAPPTKAKTNGDGKAAQKKQAAEDSSDNESGYDDDQDLLANASGITKDESDSGSSQEDDEEEEDDELAWNGTGQENGLEDDAEMNSDEDMEGGFVDLEDPNNNTHGDYMDAEEEEGEDGGQEAMEEEEEEEGQSFKPKKKTAGLYAAPTNEEVQGLKETGELFKNNVFKLQVS